MPHKPLLSDDFTAFLESGLSITMGVRDGELRPLGARAWAVLVHEDRIHLTTFLYARTATALLERLEAHPEVAVAIERPTDSRACQIKGFFVGSRRGRASDRPLVERQVDGFLKELEALGIPRALTAGWKHWPCVGVQFRVTEIFEQTPGPGAGEPMQ